MDQKLPLAAVLKLANGVALYSRILVEIGTSLKKHHLAAHLSNSTPAYSIKLYKESGHCEILQYQS